MLNLAVGKETAKGYESDYNEKHEIGRTCSTCVGREKDKNFGREIRNEGIVGSGDV
jgi:hypothetical protein